MGLTRARVLATLAALAPIVVLSAWPSAPPVPSQTARLDAHPLGAPVNVLIEFGEQYLGAELYDAKITVLDVVRGQKAWAVLRQAGQANPPPKLGFDYLIAGVKFQFSARTSPAPDSYQLNETQFTAADAYGRPYSPPDLAAYPQPPLRGILKPGDSLEGRLAFLIPKNVPKPLMVFREDVGEVSHRGGGTWFQLYERLASRAIVNP